jgi:hypothetical protein
MVPRSSCPSSDVAVMTTHWCSASGNRIISLPHLTFGAFQNHTYHCSPSNLKRDMMTKAQTHVGKTLIWEVEAISTDMDTGYRATKAIHFSVDGLPEGCVDGWVLDQKTDIAKLCDIRSCVWLWTSPHSSTLRDWRMCWLP